MSENFGEVLSGEGDRGEPEWHGKMVKLGVYEWNGGVKAGFSV